MSEWCVKLGKAGHASAINAEAHLRKLGSKGKIYRCPHCFFWHVTKNKKAAALKKKFLQKKQKLQRKEND